MLVNFMKNFNVVRVDSKGRIIVPFHIREYLNLKEGTELIVSNNGKKEIRIFPLNSSTANVYITFNDSPGSLAQLLGVISKHKVDILMSMSKTVIKGKTAEWMAIIDTTKCEPKKLEKDMKALNNVRSVVIKGN